MYWSVNNLSVWCKLLIFWLMYIWLCKNSSSFIFLYMIFYFVEFLWDCSNQIEGWFKSSTYNIILHSRSIGITLGVVIELWYRCWIACICSLLWLHILLWKLGNYRKTWGAFTVSSLWWGTNSCWLDFLLS